LPIWLLALLLAAGAPPPPAPAPAPPLPPAAMRDALLLGINRARVAAALPPIAPLPALDRVAQERAEEIRSRGALPDENEAMTLFGRVQSRLARAGYAAHGWTENLTATAGGPEAVLAAWQEDPSYAQAMDSDYQHAGIGIADLHGVPLYVFLFAWPRSEYFARQTAGLGDLAAVRREMLAIVNAARLVAGRSPLALDPRLNTAAQAHAADMLARTYYNHVSPEGSQPRGRLLGAGYTGDIVGENIAAGQTSVEDVMEAWLHSEDHRRNILDPRFTEIGIGLAVGSSEHRYKVMWVQDFARPRTPGLPPGTNHGSPPS